MTVVIYQMCAIALFLALGYIVRRKGFISDRGSQDMAWILANLCAPAQILSAVVNLETSPSVHSMLTVAAFGAAGYAVLVLLGILIGPVLRAEKKDHRFFNAIFVFSNIGFIGLPLLRVMYGDIAAAYMSILILEFDLLFFTYGYYLLRPEGRGVSRDLKLLINPGMIAAVIAIFLLFTGIRLPKVIGTIMDYGGQPVVFLAIFLIGTNLAHDDLKRLFNDPKLYLFVLIRQILVPVAFVLVIRPFVRDPVALVVLAVLMAPPPGNLPSVVAMKNGCDMDVLTRGTVFATVLSILTMPLVLLLV